jgi:hypothetical protein
MLTCPSAHFSSGEGVPMVDADFAARLEQERDAAVELLERSRRYVVAHDYNRGGMRVGPPPVGGVLRDLIAETDAILAEIKAGREP